MTGFGTPIIDTDDMDNNHRSIHIYGSDLSHTHLSLSLTILFHYSRLSSLLLSSIADVATGTPFYLAKVGQPGGTPRTIARFHDSFRGSLPQIAYNLGIPRKQRWNFLAYPPVGRSMIHASKKAL